MIVKFHCTRLQTLSNLEKKNAIIISSRVHSTNTKLNTGNLNIPLNHQLFYYSLKTIRKSSTLQTSNHLYKLNLNLTGETNQI